MWFSPGLQSQQPAWPRGATSHAHVDTWGRGHLRMGTLGVGEQDWLDAPRGPSMAPLLPCQAGDVAALNCPAQSRDRDQFLGSLPSPQLAMGDSQHGASLLPSSCLPPAPSSGQDPQGHLHHPCPGWHQAGTWLEGGGWQGERRRGCCLFCSRASLRAKRQQQLSARRSESGSLLISTPTRQALGAGRRAGAGRS